MKTAMGSALDIKEKNQLNGAPASQPVPLYTDISTMYTYMKHKRVLYVYTLTPLPLSINNTTSATGAYYTWQTSPLHQPPEYLQKSKSRSLV
jgi:hypothetical protein